MPSDQRTSLRPPGPETSAPTRLHFLDGLRGSLMVIGVPYHVAVTFSGDTWVPPGEQSPVLLVLRSLVHLWRMPAFFLVAGFFAVLILQRRGPGSWFRGRLRRLGIPLLFGLLLVNPIQALLLAYHQHGDWRTALDRWTDGIGTWTGIYHLWFLVVLLVFCAVLAALAASPWRVRAKTIAAGALDWAQASVRHLLAVIAAATVMVVLGLVAWSASGIGSLLNGVVTSDIVLQAPAFAIGAALALRPHDLHRRLAATGWPALVLVGAAGLALHIANELLRWESAAAAALVAAGNTAGGLAVALLVVRSAAQLADSRSRLVDWVVDASLPVYLVHYVFVVACAIWLLPTGMDPVAGWALSSVLVLLACVAAYEVINATPVLRLMATGRKERGATLAQVLKHRPLGHRGPPWPRAAR